jgi:hypothetical protein
LALISPSTWPSIVTDLSKNNWPLTQAENLAGLAVLNRELVAKGGNHRFTAAGSA